MKMWSTYKAAALHMFVHLPRSHRSHATWDYKEEESDLSPYIIEVANHEPSLGLFATGAISPLRNRYFVGDLEQHAWRD